MTRLRDLDGTVWYVPNGEILRVGNKSQNWSRAVVDVGVGYDEDLARAKRVLADVAHDLWEDDDYRSVIIEEPEVTGVEALTPDAITLRVLVKTAPMEQWAVARELRQRIKARFDHEGIEMPFPQRVVWHREGTRATRPQDEDPVDETDDAPASGELRQRGVERDARHGGERLAHRAVGLGVLGRGDEVVVAHAVDGRPDRDPDLGDPGARHEVDVGRGVERGGRRPGLGQAVGQRHGEAGGVGRGDQLLGAGLAVGVLGPGGPGHVEGADAGALERRLPAPSKRLPSQCVVALRVVAMPASLPDRRLDGRMDG